MNSRLDLQPWGVVRRDRLIDATPWMQVWKESVRLPDGRVIDDFYTVDQPDHVMVFAVTPDQEVICLWHYKHGPRNVNLSFPAGYLTPNEQPLDAARRELLEETGYAAAEWTGLGTFTVDGNRGNGRAHYFFARGAKRIAEPTSDDLEETQLALIALDQIAAELVGNVSTLDAVALIGLALLSAGHVNA